MPSKLTHCKYGHPLIPSNLYVYPSGKRKCRICKNRREALRARNKRRSITARQTNRERQRRAWTQLSQALDALYGHSP